MLSHASHILLTKYTNEELTLNLHYGGRKRKRRVDGL